MPPASNTFVSGVVYNTGLRDLVLTRNDGVQLTGDLSVVLHSGDNISLLNNNLGYITGFTETISSGILLVSWLMMYLMQLVDRILILVLLLL